MYRFHQIRPDFAFCVGARFLSQGREPEVEGRQWRRLSSEICARKSAIVHLVCLTIIYTIYEMCKDVASARSLYATFLERLGSLLLLVT